MSYPAMSYEIEWETRGVLIRFTGVIDRAALMEVESRLWGSPEWSRIEYELWDLTAASQSDVSSSDGVSLAYMDKAAAKSTSRKRIAFVVPETLKQDGLPAYIEAAKKNGLSVEMFRSITSARTWLAV